jgi:hypothetical protein
MANVQFPPPGAAPRSLADELRDLGFRTDIARILEQHNIELDNFANPQASEKTLTYLTSQAGFKNGWIRGFLDKLAVLAGRGVAGGPLTPARTFVNTLELALLQVGDTCRYPFDSEALPTLFSQSPAVLPPELRSEALTYARGARWLATTTAVTVTCSSRAVGLWATGRCLLEGETIVFDGAELSAQRCYARALEHDPKFARAWCYLAGLLNRGETVMVGHSRVAAHDCFGRALEVAKSVVAWNGLVDVMPLDARIPLYGRMMDFKACCAKAVQVDPGRPQTWRVLGHRLLATMDAVEVSGATYDAPYCFGRALALDGLNADAWAEAAAALQATNRNMIVHGVVLWSRDCYLRVLALNPEHLEAWRNVGDEVCEGQLTRGEGEMVSTRDCAVRALALDPFLATACCTLGVSIDPTQTITINGEEVTAKECFTRALLSNSASGKYWHRVAGVLSAGETVDVGNDTYTKQQCLVCAVTRDPNLLSAWYDLGDTLAAGESVTVHSVVTRTDCYRRTLLQFN